MALDQKIKEQVLVILQARMTSSRFPGKSLKPISSYPLAILSALRAGNTGLNVVIATSSDETDDVLAEQAHQYEIPCFRGSLDNVLGRFVQAAEHFPDDAVVVRLTADNVFPDGWLIESVIDFLLESSAEIINIPQGMDRVVPYGVSVEAFYLRCLRDAGNATGLQEYDIEHVTPWIYRNRSSARFYPGWGIVKARRCTIDYEWDYECVRNFFIQINDPMQVRCDDLIAKFDHYFPEQYPLLDTMVADLPRSSFVLGTVQLGMSYGVTNSSGMPDDHDAEALLRRAMSLGISTYDTASSYGKSEQRLAIVSKSSHYPYEIVTKLDPMDDLSEQDDETVWLERTRQSLEQSKVKLSRQILDTVMLHRYPQMEVCKGAVWKYLVDRKNAGEIKNIGVSVQSTQELEYLTEISHLDCIQLPYNLLDNRWDELLTRLKQKNNRVLIYARSIFLQGILTIEKADGLPEKMKALLMPVWSRLEVIREELGYDSLKEMAISYAKASTNVDRVVVGVAEINELDDSVNLYIRDDPERGRKLVAKINQSDFKLPEKLLNPALWKTLD